MPVHRHSATSVRDSTLTNVPWNLTRYYGNHELHFITCSCYRRQPLLGTARQRDLFLKVLEQVRKKYQFVVLGYVVMPEHFHLLISEPQDRTPSTVMQALKLGFARRVLHPMRRRRNPNLPELFERAPQHIWQKRFYDFNIWTGRKRVESYITSTVTRSHVDWWHRQNRGVGAVSALTRLARRARWQWMTGTFSR